MDRSAAASSAAWAETESWTRQLSVASPPASLAAGRGSVAAVPACARSRAPQAGSWHPLTRGAGRARGVAVATGADSWPLALITADVPPLMPTPPAPHAQACHSNLPTPPHGC
eukprot:188453-Chlamydomonas_euryale.AAC.4